MSWPIFLRWMIGEDLETQVCEPTTHSSSSLIDMFLPFTPTFPGLSLRLWVGLNDVIFLRLVQLLHILSSRHTMWKLFA